MLSFNTSGMYMCLKPIILYEQVHFDSVTLCVCGCVCVCVCLHAWARVYNDLSYPARSVRSYGPPLLPGIRASYTPHLHPFYPTRRHTRFPTDAHGKPPRDLRGDLTRSPAAPGCPPLQQNAHFQTNAVNMNWHDMIVPPLCHKCVYIEFTLPGDNTSLRVLLSVVFMLACCSSNSVLNVFQQLSNMLVKFNKLHLTYIQLLAEWRIYPSDMGAVWDYNPMDIITNI